MNAEVLDYGPEGVIPLPWGGELRFEPYTEAEPLPTYVRVVDSDGVEVVYWTVDEFTEDAPLVLGALLGAMQHGSLPR
jgi:hypothetical protein